jgi:hypothetical protein
VDFNGRIGILGVAGALRSKMIRGGSPMYFPHINAAGRATDGIVPESVKGSAVVERRDDVVTCEIGSQHRTDIDIINTFIVSKSN